MKKKTKTKTSPRVKTISKVILLCIAIGLIYITLAPDADVTSYRVSIASLKGVWTTAHPEYQGRFLQFADDVVTFGWGDKGAGSYSFGAIKTESAEQGILVDIRYHDIEAVDYHLRFHYVYKNGGILWMNNQKGVYWRRTSTEPLYDPFFK